MDDWLWVMPKGLSIFGVWPHSGPVQAEQKVARHSVCGQTAIHCSCRAAMMRTTQRQTGRNQEVRKAAVTVRLPPLDLRVLQQ